LKLRYLEEKVIFGICLFAAIVTAFLLIFIIGKIAIEGLPAINPYFLLTPESATEGLGKGILNAVIGTILISFLSTLIATPLAIGTAIYLQKYSQEGRITRTIRFFIEVLSGTPSIVLGIFGLFLLVYYMRIFTGGFSLLAGSIALAILIIPVIERAAETAIFALPPGLEEGSYALGATKWQTIRQIVIPSSISGIITGVILGFGRAAEESAVVVLTAGYTQFIPEFGMGADEKVLFGTRIFPFQDLVGTLPIFVYHGYQNSAMIPIANTFAAAFVLICIVLRINIAAKTIFWYSPRTSRNPSPLFSSLTRTLFGGNGRFSRSKPVPAPACAAADLADAERESVIRETQSRRMQKVPVTPTPISTTSELDWKETLSAGLQVGPVAGVGVREPRVSPNNDTLVISGEGPALLDNPGDFALDPVEELRLGVLPDDDPLFEDDPALLSDPPGADTGAALAELERSFMPEPPLLEEEPDPRMVEVPTDEPWRRMTRNRLENTIAGITGDPWEGP